MCITSHLSWAQEGCFLSGWCSSPSSLPLLLITFLPTRWSKTSVYKVLVLCSRTTNGWRGIKTGWGKYLLEVFHLLSSYYVKCERTLHEQAQWDLCPLVLLSKSSILSLEHGEELSLGWCGFPLPALNPLKLRKITYSLLSSLNLPDRTKKKKTGYQSSGSHIISILW